MIIGIVSDSHGRHDRLAAAIKALRDRHVEIVVHCGDVVDSQSILMLAASAENVYVVAGNMDRHAHDLAAVAAGYGVHFAWEVAEVPLDKGRCLVALHGHDESVLGEMIADGQFPYVCHGHTHRFRDERIGDVRVINPGALQHPRGHHAPSVAVLDTATDTLERIDIDA